SVPHGRVVQCHLAGHTSCGTHLIDTHDGPVIDPVWELYRLADQLTGGVSTLLEWDAQIPAFPVLHAEVLKAEGHMDASVPVGHDTRSVALERPSVTPELNDPVASHRVPHPATFVAAEVE